MQALPAGGAMVAIEATEDEFDPTEEWGIAAINGPNSVVISGVEAAVLAVAEEFAARGRKTKRLSVSHAFHSPLMEPMLADFEKVLQELTFHEPRISIVSNVTGEPASENLASPEYWVTHVREAVRFADGVRTLVERGVTNVVELGPDGVLTAMARTCVPEDADIAFASALRGERPEIQAVLTALGTLWTRGTVVDWAAFFGPANLVDLPTYAFQRQRYWLDATPSDSRAAYARQESEADALFWAAVEQEDLDSLAGTLALDVDRPLRDVLPDLAAWRRRQRDEAALDDARYRVTWQPVPDNPAATVTGRWLLLAPEDAGLDALTTAFGDRVDVRTLPDTPDRAMFADLPGDYEGVAIVVSAGDRGARESLLAAQALGDRGIDAPLWLLTRGAVSAGRGDRPTDPVQAQVWGLGRVVGLEHPERWGGVLDLPDVVDEQAAARVLGVLAGGRETEVAVRPDGVYARRLVSSPQRAGTDSWSPTGTVLVTGGTGALGGEVARWAAREGAKRLVLTSRRGAEAPGASELADELREFGVDVTLAACDLADRDAVAALVKDCGPDLTAVVHAAGVSQSTPLADTTPEEFAAVIAGKVAGAMHLHELTADLDAFVVFSSIAGVWGSAGQVAYSAANAALDALVEQRRADGLPGTAVAWGPWAGGGMAGGDGGAQLARMGLSGLAPEQAIAALARAVGSGDVTVTVADVDWSRFLPIFTATGSTPLFTALAEVDADPADQEVTDRRAELAALAPADRQRTVLDLVRAEAAIVLGLPDANAVEPARPFRDLGMDSVTSVELRDRLATVSGVRLPATAVFDHPTPDDLVAHLIAEITGDDAETGEETDEDARLRQALAALSPTTLREAGLENTLLQLAGLRAAEEESAESEEDIDSMDLDSLVQIALDDKS
ncbi:SDR family NAD(P)-dependent oxidoreductase [Saccharomonospora azurea]|nr:SDR family NAD(P)-dependent oxidoreductase [Saccharomonospora azurea]